MRIFIIILMLLTFQRVFSQEISAEISLLQGGEKLLLNVKLENHSEKDYVIYAPDYFCGSSETFVSHCFEPDEMENAMSDLKKIQYKYATENFLFVGDTIFLTFPYYTNGKIYKGLDNQETKLDDIISYIYDYEKNIEYGYDNNVLKDCYVIPKNGVKKLTFDINFLTHLRTTWALSFSTNRQAFNDEARKLIKNKGLEIYSGAILSNTIFFSTQGQMK
ncbi:MAG: hypothetical protein K5685_07965 [Bacteroidales bacterium]|nr:hypothetical protein [Bacteroidales bacterium]